MAINKTLLRKTRNRILKFPEGYDQLSYGHEHPAAPCGTAACLAGEILLAAGYCTPRELVERVRVNPETGQLESFHVPVIATKLLGLKQVKGLFGSGGAWPPPFAERFATAGSKKEEARVAADLINHILRTGKVN